MSVVSGESAGSVGQLAGKGADIAADLLKAFLNWLVNLRRRHLENVLIGEQGRLYRNVRKTMDAKMAIQEGRGLVKAQELSRSGEPLIAGATALDARQRKEFARLAKNYGLTYTFIKNDYDPSNKKLIMFAQKDIQKVKDITDRMTENAQIREIDKRINQLHLKGPGNFTVQDYKDLADLEDLRDSKIAAPIDMLNKAGNERTFEEISGELKQRQQNENGPMTFDRALNHITSRDYSSDDSYFLVERTNPNSFIQLDSKREVFDGEEYTKTYYQVNRDGEMVGTYDDGRFEGRDKYYWMNLKTSMKAAGHFTDDVVILKSKAEFDQYIAAYNKSLAREQSQEMEESLYDAGAVFDESIGEVKDYQSDVLVRERLKDPGITYDERFRLSKALVIGDLIKIARNLEILQNDEARVNYLMRPAVPNSREQYYLNQRLDLIKAEQEKYQELGREKEQLIAKLRSLEAMHELGNEPAIENKDLTRQLGRALAAEGAFFDEITGEAIEYNSGDLVRNRLSQTDRTDTDYLRLSKALVVSDQIKCVKNLEILQNRETELMDAMNSTEPGSLQHYVIEGQLGIVRKEQENYRELLLEKTREYDELNSTQELRELSSAEVSDVRARKDPDREIENNTVSSNVLDLRNTDWRSSMETGRQYAAAASGDFGTAGKPRTFER